MYSLLLVLIYIAFISLGLPDSLLGSGWPVMHADLDVPVSYMGIVTMVISGCTIISSLFSAKLSRKPGTRWVTVISVFLTAGALLAIDAVLNNFVALNYKSKHMSWLHCFWGVGTIASPFVMSYALSSSTWNMGFRIIGFVQLGIGVLLLVTLPVWKATKKTCPTAEVPEQTQKPLGPLKVLRIKGVPFLLLGFFAYCAAEATTMQWASTYFVSVKGLSEDLAAQLASLFYIGITAGRLLSGFVSDKLGDRKMIIVGTCILLCGVVLLALPIAGYGAAVAAFVVIGVGCAPIYPCIIHSTPANFGAENSGSIIGIQMASAYLGSTFMPPLFGLIGGKTGFSFMPYYLLAFFLLMIVMTEITFRKTQKPLSLPENSKPGGKE